jgi:sugar phosphate isomerase/epimerase
MLRFTFSTASIHTYGTSRTFEIAKQAGFDGMELMIDYRPDTRDADYIQRLIDRFQIPVLSVHSPFSMYAQGWSQDDAEAVQRSVQMAETLGAEAVVVHLPPKIDFTALELSIGSWRKRVMTWLPGSRYRRFQRWMETDFTAFQDSTSVELCVENLPAHILAWKRRNLYAWNPVSMQHLEPIKRFRALTMDTTHLATWGLEPADVYPHWNSHIRHVHLSNYDGQEHRLPNEGRLRLDRLVNLLARDQFNGTITLELYPAVCGAGNPDTMVIDRLAHSLEVCRSWA